MSFAIVSDSRGPFIVFYYFKNNESNHSLLTAALDTFNICPNWVCLIIMTVLVLSKDIQYILDH